MKLDKVIAKLSQIGTVEKRESFFFMKINGKVVEFAADGYVEDNNDVVGFIVKDEQNDYTDCETNLYSGVVCDNLKQVMKRIGVAK